MTARELAELCGVQLRAVHHWVARGLVPHFRTPGRHLRFVPDEVRDFVARRLQPAPSGARRVALVVAPPGVRAAIRRALRAFSVRWAAEPRAALVEAGRTPPDLVVLHWGAVKRLDLRAYERAVRRELGGARLVVVGSAVRGVPRSVIRVDGIDGLSDVGLGRRPLPAGRRPPPEPA
jgi:excisionase family DNA binding protein